MSAETIDRYFQSMRRGSEGGDELFALFTEDAVYVEPFSGKGPAIGIEAIKSRFQFGWEQEMEDLELDVLEIQIDGPEATARWECRSSSLPGPVRGQDRYRFSDGRIVRLEVEILNPAE